MSNHDYIPRPDGDFNDWQRNFIEKLEAKSTIWGIPPEEVTGIKAKQAVWDSAYAKTAMYQGFNTPDIRAKEDARDDYETSIRDLTKGWLAFNKKVTNSDRESLGITVYSDTRTPVGVPTSAPILKVDFSVSLQHTIHYANGITNGKAKPVGVHGCEIWVKVGGAAPVSDDEFKFVGLDTNSPYVCSYPIGDRGKIVYYRIRWINARGQQGPWSEVVSAVIA